MKRSVASQRMKGSNRAKVSVAVNGLRVLEPDDDCY